MEVPEALLQEQQFVGWMTCILGLVQRPIPLVSAAAPEFEVTAGGFLDAVEQPVRLLLHQAGALEGLDTSVSLVDSQVFNMSSPCQLCTQFAQGACGETPRVCQALTEEWIPGLVGGWVGRQAGG
jgi:hypothetical protein